ncbi:MAG: helix-turn-helix domain-containing protein [Devosia sp.]|nr:helix-turn-helix domain-containing protein [Devosia sp.]
MQTVKSVGRTLALLELFDELKRPATVMEIARALGCPQSSTSALLHSMVALGYCEFNPASRTYIPTARVALLGMWLEASLLHNGAVLRLLNDVNEQTGEHVLLAVRHGLEVRYIYTLAARHPDRPHIRTGTIRRLGRSGAGNLFLATQPDNQIATLVRRINAEETDPAYRIELKPLMVEVAEIRERGYSLSIDRVTPGIGGVNVLLPQINRTQPMAISLSSLSGIVTRQHEDIVQCIRDSIARHLDQDLPPIRP